MRRLVVTLTATAAILLAGSVAWKADAQTSRGAIIAPEQEQNFSPIRQTACGPFWGGALRSMAPLGMRPLRPPLLVRPLLVAPSLACRAKIIEVAPVGGLFHFRPSVQVR
jgi:hypothetical protein